MALRPSHKELMGKIRTASSAIMEGRRFFANTDKSVGELYNLEIDNQQLWELLPKLLSEIEALGIDRCYCGKKPPEKSYEGKIKEADLFAFAWDSNLLEKKMYLKFAIVGEKFFYISLHESVY